MGMLQAAPFDMLFLGGTDRNGIYFSSADHLKDTYWDVCPTCIHMTLRN